MLQNASLLAIVAVHTAENEPSEVCDGHDRLGNPHGHRGEDNADENRAARRHELPNGGKVILQAQEETAIPSGGARTEGRSRDHAGEAQQLHQEGLDGRRQ